MPSIIIVHGYRETIGANPDAELIVRSIPGANHMLRQARTGGVREQNTESWDWPYAEGYFESMADWLVAKGSTLGRSGGPSPGVGVKYR